MTTRQRVSDPHGWSRTTLAELDLREHLAEVIPDPVALRDAVEKLDALLNLAELTVTDESMELVIRATGISDDELAEAIDNLSDKEHAY